jgi:FkbM family methyltransferase
MQALLRDIRRAVDKWTPFRSQHFGIPSVIQAEVMSCDETVFDARAKLTINPNDLQAQEQIIRAQAKKFYLIKEKLDKGITKENDFFKKIGFSRFNMYLDASDKGSIYTFICYLANLLEPFELCTFCEMICRNPDSLVIDVGANYGLYTLHACDLACYNIVHSVIAVEPDRRVFNKLKLSLKENGFNLNTIPINKAISDTDNKRVELYINDAGSVDNRTISNEGISNIIDHYPVETITLDSIIDEHERSGQKAKSIIIKMDIQGREPLAFRGMRRTLNNYSSIAVLFEFDPRLIRSGGQNPYKFADEIFSAGFNKYINVDGTAHLHRALESTDDFRRLIKLCESMGHNDPRRYTTIFAYREMAEPKALRVV